MDLQEAVERIQDTLNHVEFPLSNEREAIIFLVDFAKDYLTHRIPLRVSPHQLGEFAKEWFIQDKDGRTMLPETPDCGNVHRLFRDMNEKELNFHWSFNPRMTDEERREIK